MKKGSLKLILGLLLAFLFTVLLIIVLRGQLKNVFG